MTNQEIAEKGSQEPSELYKEIEDAVNQHMLRTGKWPSYLRIGEVIWETIRDDLGEDTEQFLGIPVSIVSREKDPSDFFRYSMQ